ncbi:hypothetical protein L5515_001140 [Caenorhabditis briggsae]|uniref:ShKT domain-containing protein n=1 Tax=Caenorhabditis briggsae TaxID=6238 RepID=A0AAE9E1Z5_CAEBR|nr:hypothetical protein L5515_001140 [Caenorhabditis briggsae]
MFLRQLFISFAIFSVAYSQTCDATASSGPCGDIFGTACSNNQVCDEVAGQCCPVTTAAATTTAAAVTTIVTDSDGSTVTATVTTAATGTVTSSTTTCVDRTNPSTGVSDCPALAYLCNDSTYYTVMTQQCPRTCGRCNTTSTSSTSCVDRVNPSTGVSDCPARAALCNDSTYYAVMTQQCPRTCGRCNSTSSTTTSTSTSCADRVNPSTGVSDCPARAALCNNSVYYDLMTVQCPATCGRCSSSSSTVTSSSSTTVSSTCVDQVNAATGTSDCPNRRAFCTNSAYISLMRTQCPLTCGFCTSG